MNLFVVGWSSRRAPDPRRAEAAVRDLAGALPFLDGAEVGTWHAPSGAAAAAWASDPVESASPVAYAGVEEERLMLWAGRPVRWDAAGGADGRTPLDPGFYLPPAHHWAGALDGRFTAIRYDDADRSLAALADAMGAYPLYLTDVDGVTWISNRAEPLRALAGSRAVDLDSLAALLGGGWPLGGRPVWAAVRRVAPGLLSLHPEGGEGHRDLLLASDVARMCGAGFDAPRGGADAGRLRARARRLAGPAERRPCHRGPRLAPRPGRGAARGDRLRRRDRRRARLARRGHGASGVRGRGDRA